MMSECIEDEYKKLKARNTSKYPNNYREPDTKRFEKLDSKQSLIKLRHIIGAQLKNNQIAY